MDSPLVITFFHLMCHQTPPESSIDTFEHSSDQDSPWSSTVCRYEPSSSCVQLCPNQSGPFQRSACLKLRLTLLEVVVADRHTDVVLQTG